MKRTLFLLLLAAPVESAELVLYGPGESGTNATISLILEKTASAVLFMEIETANAGLNAVVSMERCLTEVLDPAIISQVHYLRGMVAVGSGNQAQSCFDLPGNCTFNASCN